MKILDVRTTLLTGPCTNDPFLREARKLRSAAFIEIITEGPIGIGETYAGYFCPEVVPSIVDFFRPILLGQTVDDIPELWRRMYRSYRNKRCGGRCVKNGYRAPRSTRTITTRCRRITRCGNFQMSSSRRIFPARARVPIFPDSSGKSSRSTSAGSSAANRY